MKRLLFLSDWYKNLLYFLLNRTSLVTRNSDSRRLNVFIVGAKPQQKEAIILSDCLFIVDESVWDFLTFRVAVTVFNDLNGKNTTLFLQFD